MPLFLIKREADNLVTGITETYDNTVLDLDARYLDLDAMVELFPEAQDQDYFLNKIVDVENLTVSDPAPVEPDPDDPTAVRLATSARSYSIGQYRDKFTLAEKTAIYTAAETDTTVQIFLDDLASAAFVDPQDPQTIGGIDYLISVGLLAAERRDFMLADKNTL